MVESRRLNELAAGINLEVPAGPLLVALSGGADSAALLWLCARSGREVRAVHVHHGRPASDRLRSAAEVIAGAVGTGIEVLSVRVPPGASYEARAREVRYAALAAEAREGEWILTGHTADDQAETVLDHLLRTSGPDGLRGIAPKYGRILRPLLTVTRAETRELAALAGLAWIDDPENESLDPLRNRIRHRLIPALEAEYNPRLRRALATTARLVAADVDHLESLVSLPIHRVAGGFAAPASILTTAAAAPAARMARRFLAAAGIEHAGEAAVGSVLDVAAGRIERYQPTSGVVLERVGSRVVARVAEVAAPQPVELSVPGETRFGPWAFDALVSDQPPPAMPLGASWMVADLDAVGRLTLEAAGSRSAMIALLAAGGVAASERPSWPLLASEGEPVWLPYLRRLGSGWVRPGTRRYLVVRIRSSEEWHH